MSDVGTVSSPAPSATAATSPPAAGVAQPAAAPVSSAAPEEFDFDSVSTADLAREAGIDWRELLPEHVTDKDGKPVLGADGKPLPLRGHKSLASYKDIAGLATSHLNLEKKLGERAPDPPKDLTAYADVKVPTREGLPEPNQALIERLAKPAFLKNGLSPQQAQGVLELYADYVQQERRAVADAFIEGQEKLREEWGHLRFDSEMAIAQRGLRKFADQDFLQWLDATQGSMHPGAIRYFNKIGHQLAEDGIIDSSSLGAPSEEDLQKEIASVRADLVNATGTRKRELETRRDALYKALYGTQEHTGRFPGPPR